MKFTLSFQRRKNTRWLGVVLQRNGSKHRLTDVSRLPNHGRSSVSRRKAGVLHYHSKVRALVVPTASNMLKMANTDIDLTSEKLAQLIHSTTQLMKSIQSSHFGMTVTSFRSALYNVFWSYL
ncbi:hypothetical protein ACTXT7_016905 [Hymenolepis weldensis]